jgi:serine protease
MRSARNNLLPAVATAGVLAAMGATALPMLPAWLRSDAPAPVPSIAPAQVALQGVAAPEIVVDLRDDASPADVRDLDSRFGLNLVPNSIEAVDDKLMVASVPSGVDMNELLARLRADGRVEVAEPEQIFSIPEIGQAGVPTDGVQAGSVVTISYGDSTITCRLSDVDMPSLASRAAPLSPDVAVSDARWTASNDGFDSAFRPNDPRYNEQWNFQMIDVESAWKRARGKGVVVAVLDTGVAGGDVKRGKPCRDFGQTKFVKGYDFVHKDDDPYDDHGHGTHVAGTIAESTNNNEGVAGIAFDAQIMPLKVLSATGSGTSADIADAIRYAADHGANVINMSLGSAYPSDVIHKAVKYAHKKGVTIVCAAGNSFGGPVGYPAAYPECIAVSAVGPSGDIAKYSSYGKQVALAAPGGDMIDSGNAADGILQNTNYPESQGGRGDDYYAFQGTSMASPHVAAVAALIESQGVTDPARVREILIKSAVPKNDPNKYGAGVLSAAQATAKAAQLGAIKLRHLLVFGLGFLIFAVGGRRRNFGLRLAMFGALAVGFFGPDWFTSLVGADSAWNLIGFSALLPIVLYAALRRGPSVKIAGMLGLGIGVCLWANWHNDTLPFTTATFGDAPMPWVAANVIAAIGVGLAAARRAFRATNRPAA